MLQTHELPLPALNRVWARRGSILTTLSSVSTEMLKDKNRPVVPIRGRGPQGRKRRPGEAEESAQPEMAASSVETCRALLRSILTHWGPVDSGPEPSQDQATHESQVESPMHAAASLVAGWVLCSVAECPLSRAETAGLLGWLKSHILPHPGVVADLLGDAAVKRSLFQLYSCLCSAKGLAGSMQDVAILFNTVMLQLLAAQGHMRSPFHLAVEALCTSSVQEEDSNARGNAAWLGRSRGGVSGPGLGAAPAASHFLHWFLKYSGNPTA